MGRRLRETFHILKPSILDRILGAYVRLIHFLYKQKRGRYEQSSQPFSASWTASLIGSLVSSFVLQ